MAPWPRSGADRERLPQSPALGRRRPAAPQPGGSGSCRALGSEGSAAEFRQAALRGNGTAWQRSSYLKAREAGLYLLKIRISHGGLCISQNSQ